MKVVATTSPIAQFRYRFGKAEFDESRFELRVDGQMVEVQRKPLEILALLLSQPGEVVTKQELLEIVWQGRPTVDNVVANAIAKLRSALGESDAARIVTLPRIGYRFDGSLERVTVGRVLPSVLGLTAGQQVPERPHFQLDERIGQSASNEVWLARHVKTRERRVFKFCTGGGRLSLLKREITLSRLLQDNLGERAGAFTRVLDWNLETPPLFLECEYGGQDLLRWASANGQLAGMLLTERLALFLQVADAVAAAHSIGVLHKDLKPANILVAQEGSDWRVRLTDFGSSHLLEPQRLAELGITQLGFTMTGSMLSDSTIGTPLYLAPEMIAGQPPTAASDTYALGVILYQLIVGDLKRPLAPGWERGVPDPLLRDAIALATDGDPTQRLASVGELVSRVRGFATRQAEPQESKPAGDARAARAAVKSSRGMRLWLVATALAAVVLPGAVTTFSHDSAIVSAEIQGNRLPLRIFYAEVMDVYRHYLFTDEELVSDPGHRDFRLQLNLAMYGESPFTRAQLDEIGLHPSEIPLAMELLLLIRNNDLRIADVLDNQESDRQTASRRTETLRKRVKSTRDTAYSLLTALHKRQRQLGELPPPPG